MANIVNELRKQGASVVEVKVRNKVRRRKQRAGHVFPAATKKGSSERTVQVPVARLREITACRDLEVVGKPKIIKKAPVKAVPARTSGGLTQEQVNALIEERASALVDEKLAELHADSSGGDDGDAGKGSDDS